MTATWRCYFDKASEGPLYWCVDSGDGTAEQKFQYLRIVGGDVKSCTEMEHRGSEEKPCAWFEVYGWLETTGLSATILGAVK